MTTRFETTEQTRRATLEHLTDILNESSSHLAGAFDVPMNGVTLMECMNVARAFINLQNGMRKLDERLSIMSRPSDVE